MREFNHHPNKNLDEIIRDSVENLSVPVDRAALRGRFLSAARQSAPAGKPVAGSWYALLFGPQFCLACSLILTVAFGIHFFLRICNDPVASIQFKGKETNPSVQQNPWENPIRSYRTAAGQFIQYPAQTELLLTDKTRIVSNEDSIFSIEYTPQERRITLLQGTLDISANHNALHPMIVQVSGTEIRVTGTRFIVSTSNK